jgi:hypothetical protein
MVHLLQRQQEGAARLAREEWRQREASREHAPHPGLRGLLGSADEDGRLDSMAVDALLRRAIGAVPGVENSHVDLVGRLQAQKQRALALCEGKHT